MDVTTKQARILAEFNRGRLTAKQAQKMIAKLAIRKGARRNKYR